MLHKDCTQVSERKFLSLLACTYNAIYAIKKIGSMLIKPYWLSSHGFHTIRTPLGAAELHLIYSYSIGVEIRSIAKPDAHFQINSCYTQWKMYFVNSSGTGPFFTNPLQNSIGKCNMLNST